MIGTSSLRKAAPASTTQAPSPSIADPERIGDNDSVAKGGVSAATAEKKRRQPTDDCVQIEKREGDLCEGGNSIVETKAMPVAISASKRMRCANPDGRVASQVRAKGLGLDRYAFFLVMKSMPSETFRQPLNV